jgi:hypothetical protein
MRDIIKHILKEEKQSKFFGTIDKVLNDSLYVDFIHGTFGVEEIYSAHFGCTNYVKLLSDNPYDASMLVVAIEDNSYNVNYIDNELYGNEHLEKENRELVFYITFFITSVFKLEDKINLKEVKSKVKEFLNDKIKKYAIENNINLYEKHDLNW